VPGGDVPVGIPDDLVDTSGDTEATATVSNGSTIVDLTVTIDLDHTWIGDLDIFLESPAGTSVQLFNQFGGSGDDLEDVTFDDDALDLISSGTPPYGPGDFAPVEALSAFDGENAFGDWTLLVVDTATQDTGTLQSWSIDFVLDGTGDTDGDGVLSCTDCDDGDAASFPAAPVACDGADNDCDGDVADDEENPGVSEACAVAGGCEDVLLAYPGAPDDSYFVTDPSLASPMELSCDMTTDGGGWIELELDDSDSILVASWGPSNPWHKCADDAAQFFGSVAVDTDAVQDFGIDAVSINNVALTYVNPDSGDAYDADELAVLRALVTELNDSTRMVTTSADDDSFSWQDGDGGGHEVSAYDADGDQLVLTPGTNGQCGGSSGWPLAGSQSAFYLWSTDPAQTAVAGTTGVTAGDLGALPTDFILPASVDLIVQTGGGVSFGWEEAEFLVR